VPTNGHILHGKRPCQTEYAEWPMPGIKFDLAKVLFHSKFTFANRVYHRYFVVANASNDRRQLFAFGAPLIYGRMNAPTAYCHLKAKSDYQDQRQLPSGMAPSASLKEMNMCLGLLQKTHTNAQSVL
jgi:hypothetical protein